MTASCLTFQRSIELLNIQNQCGAYGALGEGLQCDLVWSSIARESWCRALSQSQSDIERDIGKQICEVQIYDEIHTLRPEIKLNLKPISYVGQKSYSAWAEKTLTLEDTGDLTGYYYICVLDSEIPAGVDPLTQIEFTYSDDVLQCGSYCQQLNAPCEIVQTADCDGGANPGYRYYWPLCNLVRPDTDSGNLSEPAGGSFLTDLNWRSWTIDSTLAAEAIAVCGCSNCAGTVPVLEVCVIDETTGAVCVESSNCSSFMGTRAKFSYGASVFRDGVDESLELAVVLRALILARYTIGKPCDCDNRWIDWWLEPDETATTEFASKLRYGGTRAGMEVMRIVDRYMKRPQFNTPGEQSGGAFMGRRMGKIGQF